MHPAWQILEELHGTRCRPGRKRGNVWSKCLTAVGLIEELSKARGSVDAAAREWGRALGAAKSKPGVATLCRAGERAKLLQMVGL